ncbi:MAG TPA: radical SAM protein [Flavisolibacter sp.]|nr:radical SAM protein [Flavisolibacter sp.]
MQTTISLEHHLYQSAAEVDAISTSLTHVKGWQKGFTWWRIKMRIFYFTCIILKHPKKIWQVYKTMLSLRTNVWGGDLKKLYRVDRKYYFNQYTPGWPSKAYDALIKSELRRHANPGFIKEKLSFIFLAITRKCPMRCEHCFEWDNLNKKESFTLDDLYKVVDMYQKEGVLQIHFSGGEPMVRYRDLIKLLRFASIKTECWVLSSGFNVTEQTAQELKAAGCKGMVISIDHYLPHKHDLFRGKQGSFAMATKAVRCAQKAGLVTSISVCATKQFIEEEHLLPYMNFAKDLGVQFVQVLEPRQVGHYADKEVHLETSHIDLLEKTFVTINHSPNYREYPTMLYHGYHQRRVGCFSGSRSVYIDSAGDVHACPFCHTKSYNIISLVRNQETILPEKKNECPKFDKIA